MLVVLEAVLGLEVIVHLVLDELRRHGNVDLLEQRVDELVTSGRALGEDALLVHTLGEAVAQLTDRVELAGDLRELVISLGQLALLDRCDRHRDLSLLTGVVTADELRTERGVLTSGQRLDGVIDALEQLAGADLVRDALSTVDLGSVDRGDQVELDEVSRGSRAVDGDERAEAGAQLVELFVQGRIVRLDGIHSQGDVGELRHLDLGAHVHLDLDDQVAGEVLLVRPLRDVGRRTADHAEIVLARGLAEERVEALVDGVLDDRTAADALIDDRRRDLALAEAGDLDVLSNVLVRVRDAGLEVVRGDRDGELGPGRGQLLNGAVRHACVFSFGFPRKTRGLKFVGPWSGRQDLNLRLPAPKAGALPSFSLPN